MGASILLTGATGYIGGRLLRRPRRGRPRRCVPGAASASASPPAPTPRWSRAIASTSRRSTRALAGVTRPTTWCTRWRRGRLRGPGSPGRRQLRPRRRRAGVRRIIYLGGLADDAASLSPHLKSRAETGDVLRASRRAGHRVPRVDRHRRRQPVVRDDSGAGRAAAGDDLPALGAHADAADRRRRRAARIWAPPSICRTTATDLRDRRARGRVLRRHDARVRAAAWTAPAAAAGARADAAAVRPVARAGDAGAGARRPRRSSRG